MVRFVLIRPGSTDFDEQGRIQGTLDIPLSSRGASEAARIAEELKGQDLSILYSAPCQSAWQTAEVIAETLGIKAKKLDKLHNVDHGLWQGMLVDEVRHKQPKVYRQWQENPAIVCPPEGEMLAQVEERIQSAFAKVLKKHRAGVVGLVLPEPLASIVQSCLADSAVGDLWDCSSGCGTWEIVNPDAQVVDTKTLVVRVEQPAPNDSPISMGQR
jgi:probable phosphoglycerate mutase